MYIMVCILFHALVAQFLYMQVSGFQVDCVIVNHDVISLLSVIMVLWYCVVICISHTIKADSFDCLIL